MHQEYTMDESGAVVGLSLCGVENLQQKLNRMAVILAELTYLDELLLFNSELTDISVLASLTSLTKLNLTFNRLKNISVLAELKNLTKLYVAVLYDFFK